MAADLKFVFGKAQRERFRSGELVSEWMERYPKLFDECDKRVVMTEHQRRYNFCEWLAAVLIFESTGYRSLIAKYTANSHPTKNERLRRALPADLAEWVFANESGQPDLFVYSKKDKDWFFCEVKGPGDRMRVNQVKWRADFESLLVANKDESSNRYRVFRLDQADA